MQQLSDNPDAAKPTPGQIKNAIAEHEIHRGKRDRDYAIPTIRMRHPDGREVVVNDPDCSHPSVKCPKTGVQLDTEFIKWRAQGFKRVSRAAPQPQSIAEGKIEVSSTPQPEEPLEDFPKPKEGEAANQSAGVVLPSEVPLSIPAMERGNLDVPKPAAKPKRLRVKKPE